MKPIVNVNLAKLKRLTQTIVDHFEKSRVPNVKDIAKEANFICENLVGDLRTELSERQFEVMLLVIDGLSNAAICDRTGLASETVRGYIWRIFKATGVKTREELIEAFKEQKPDDPGVEGK